MKQTIEILKAAKAASATLCTLTTEKKNAALAAMADALVAASADILAANAGDVEAARETLGEVMIDRLTLTPARIEGMADGIRAVAALPDPVGRVIDTTERADGLHIEKVGVPMGVVAIIYESRPNVTSDAAALAIKSGNVCVLRGGKEAYRSASAIVAAMKRGLAAVCSVLAAVPGSFAPASSVPRCRSFRRVRVFATSMLTRVPSLIWH